MLEGISIKTIRQLISRLISQGFDRTKAQRLDEQDLLVIKSACVGQIGIVAELKERTSAITQTLAEMTEAMKTCASEVRLQLEHALTILEPAARGNQKPVDNTVFDRDESRRRRPHSAIVQSKTFDATDMDKSSSISFDDLTSTNINSDRYADSMVNRRPRLAGSSRRLPVATGHENLAALNLRVISRAPDTGTRRNCLPESNGLGSVVSISRDLPAAYGSSSGGVGQGQRAQTDNEVTLAQLFFNSATDVSDNSGTLDAPLETAARTSAPAGAVSLGHADNFQNRRAWMFQQQAAASLRVMPDGHAKQVQQMMRTLFDGTMSLQLIKEVWQHLRSMDGQDLDEFQSHETNRVLDSDEEEELYEEVQRISDAQEKLIDDELLWEFESSRLWNSASMQLAQIEQAFASIRLLIAPQSRAADPKVPMDHVARGLVYLGVEPHHVDLDLILDECQEGARHVEIQGLTYQGHYSMTNSDVRLSALLISKTFRNWGRS